ncbi:DUF3168 domain-containing protein [Shimia ponticola]|uniref:DUF3168 domain-containing protein n=1 Tax=Shimia ponticola TaxID=2582893 RepID=UPI0011BDB9D3|nr:DUF3168 domain-containing protein [Shimia ponticola]
MSYAGSSALQQAVFEELMAHAALNALVGSHVYDAVPSGTIPDLYVSLGPEDVLDRSDQNGHGARHDFVISVVSQASGFQEAKDVAAAVCDALIGAELSLSRGTLVGLWFLKAKAGRSGTNDNIRRIDLRFRARIDGV